MPDERKPITPSQSVSADPLVPTGVSGIEPKADGTLGDALVLDEPSLSSETTDEERKRGMIVLFLSLIIVGMGHSIVFNILPPLARKMGYQEWQVTTIFAVSAFCWVFSSPFWGLKSDIWGRKISILIGTTGYTVSMLLFATAIQAVEAGAVSLASGFFLMITARSIFGVFGSSTNPAANAYVADRTSLKDRAAGMGLLAAAFGVGGILGPGVAGALSIFGLLVPIYFIAVMGAVSGALVWFFLPERTKPSQRIKRARIPLFDRRVLPFIIFGILLSLVQSITGATITFYFMDKLDLSPDIAPQYTAPAFMVSALAALFAQFVFIQHFGLKTRTLMRWGIGISIITYCAFVVSPSYGPLMFAMMLQGLGFGLARPGFSAAASLAVEPEEQGAVAGLIGGTGAAGHIMIPFIVYYFYQGISPEAPYMLGAVVLVGLFATLFIVPAFKAKRDH
jgi:MFS family permease